MGFGQRIKVSGDEGEQCRGKAAVCCGKRVDRVSRLMCTNSFDKVAEHRPGVYHLLCLVPGMQ